MYSFYVGNVVIKKNILSKIENLVIVVLKFMKNFNNYKLF